MEGGDGRHWPVHLKMVKMATSLHAFPLSKETHPTVSLLKLVFPCLPSPPHPWTLSPVTLSPFKLFDVVLNNLPLGKSKQTTEFTPGGYTSRSKQGLVWAIWERSVSLPRVVLLSWRGGKSCKHSPQTQTIVLFGASGVFSNRSQELLQGLVTLARLWFDRFSLVVSSRLAG